MATVAANPTPAASSPNFGGQVIDFSTIDDGVDDVKTAQVDKKPAAKPAATASVQNETVIRLLPGDGATVIGASSGLAQGGAFVLVPNEGFLKALEKGDPTEIWDKGLSQSTIFLTGSNAVLTFMSQVGVSKSNPVYRQAAKLGANAVLTFKIADGSMELGVGKSLKVAGGNGLVFWNMRAETSSVTEGLFPNGARVSGNAGLLGNAGKAGGKLIDSVANAMMRAPAPQVRVAGAVIKAVNEGAGAFGRATQTDLWVGAAGRADITIGGTDQLRVLGPNGKTMDIPRLPELPDFGAPKKDAPWKPGDQ